MLQQDSTECVSTEQGQLACGDHTGPRYLPRSTATGPGHTRGPGVLSSVPLTQRELETVRVSHAPGPRASQAAPGDTVVSWVQQYMYP